ncbi:MAG: DUF2007 domain-containing protein [Phormidesmis sp. FL-bin-119]|jgi:uncharacterized protein (DUF1919 family)|nr:DUF2007 domain-containing protein [Pedobacter sp.]
MEAGWIKIYTSADFFKSELVRQVLTDNEIGAIIINKQGFPYRIGEVEVYIHEDNFQKALEIIIKNEL